MISTITKQSEINISELYALRYEVQEACANQASYMVREQIIRFECILRYYLDKYDLNGRYVKATHDMKLMFFRQTEYNHIQKRLLEELRRLALDVNYLAHS